jgi:hypothetical protein
VCAEPAWSSDCGSSSFFCQNHTSRLDQVLDDFELESAAA